jgi:16S rRNA (cytosine1402-N4)-methyltransferase
VEHDYQHLPVLLEEVLVYLALKPDGIYVDGTYGRGGHSKAILAQLGNSGRLLALDKDPEAVANAQTLMNKDPRFSITHSAFANIVDVCRCHHVVGEIDGIILDLGVSSPQLDDAARGFSFQREGPLDMRMDSSQALTAATWLQQVDAKVLSKVLREYGEERFAGRIARAIVEARNQAPLTTTLQLAEVVAKANPRWEKKIHPATRTFQAIRIFINNELAELQKGLEEGLKVLKKGGRLLAISFHSLEDKIIKSFIKQQTGGNLPRKLPITHAALQPSIKQIKVVAPSEQEIIKNPRARSAKLRVLEKLV